MVMVEVRVQSGCGEIREMELAMVAVRINEEMSSRSDRCMRMAMVIQMHRGLKDLFKGRLASISVNREDE